MAAVFGPYRTMARVQPLFSPSPGMPTVQPDVPLICVVDDDDSIRESLQGLLQSIGFAVETFSSAQAFLDSDCHTRNDCLILDVRMPGMRGPDLQRELARRKCHMPIVFI